jgi:hypothetical protein
MHPHAVLIAGARRGLYNFIDGEMKGLIGCIDARKEEEEEEEEREREREREREPGTSSVVSTTN